MQHLRHGSSRALTSKYELPNRISESGRWTRADPRSLEDKASIYSQGVNAMANAIKFGTDGWRGVIGEDFTVANARIVAAAIARYVARAEDPRKGVLIGYDHRSNSEEVAGVVAEVISASGTPVWLADKPCPTPTISLLVRQRNAAGGIVVTASHNPHGWNGIKYKASYGSSALPSIVAQIENELAHVLSNGTRELPARKELIHVLEPQAPYLDTIEKLVDWRRLRDAKFRFVVDPMHGSAAGLLHNLFVRNGVTSEEIRGTRDSRFGGVHPEPIEPHIEALRKAVVTIKFDAGFAADGDGDRIGAIDRDGTFVNPHQIFALLVWHLVGTRKLPGDIAKTFSVTKLIDALASKYARKLHEVPIGFKYICELMLEQNILIGGEESGGIGTSLYLPERDATVSALLLAELMAWHGRSLGELIGALHREFGEFHYGRVDLEVKPEQRQKAIEHFSSENLKKLKDWTITRREEMDGIKLYLDDFGWVMVRASGTENLLRIYSETSKATTTQEVLPATVAAIQTL
jgi:alpha-D-glucose phosphate-specific phosphoglucomutase